MSEDLSTAMPPLPEGYRKGRHQALRFAGMCLAVSTLMAVAKVGFGLYLGSHAVLASALYSVNDILSAVAISISLRMGSRPANASYQYGYGKAEFIAVAIVSLAIALGVVTMFSFSVLDLATGVQGPPHFTAMTLAALSLGVSWFLYRQGHRLTYKVRSPALVTCTQHLHADVLGSGAAIVGVLGAVMGFHALDRAVAIGETLHLVVLSGALLAKSSKGLLDGAMPDEDTSLVEEACRNVRGVTRVAHIRSRQNGDNTWIDVAIGVSEAFSVRQAQRVSAKVKKAIHGVVGGAVVAQVRFQSADLEPELPGPAGAIDE